MDTYPYTKVAARRLTLLLVGDLWLRPVCNYHTGLLVSKWFKENFASQHGKTILKKHAAKKQWKMNVAPVALNKINANNYGHVAQPAS